MFAGGVKILCGDVVASTKSTFFVQAIDDDGMTVLRIEARGPVRHRADIEPEHWTDLALSGIGLHEVVVRCVPLRRYTACNLTKVGTVSDAMRRRIHSALQREMLVRRFEDSPPMRSNLDASTSSRGRRVVIARNA